MFLKLSERTFYLFDKLFGLFTRDLLFYVCLRFSKTKHLLDKRLCKVCAAFSYLNPQTEATEGTQMRW